MAAAGFQESRGAGAKVSIVKADVILLGSFYGFLYFCSKAGDFFGKRIIGNWI